MNVHLTPELERLVQRKVKSGRYNSASEVVREALRLAEERDDLLEFRKRELSKQIAAGLAQLRRGNAVDGEEFFSQLERREGAQRKQQSSERTGSSKRSREAGRRKTA